MGRPRKDSGPIYVYEINKSFDDPFDFADQYGVSIIDIGNALRSGTTCNGMHIVRDGNLRRNLWRPIQIVETGMIFPSETHAAYHFGVSKMMISKVMHSYDHKFRNYHLEYVKE